jgi:hypothetical protein
MRVAEKVDWKRLKIKKKRWEQENHNVGRSDIGSERVKGYKLLFFLLQNIISYPTK